MRTVLPSFLTLISIALTSAVGAHAATISDYAADFSSATNPSGSWTYGAVTTLGAPPTLSTQISNYGPGNEVQAWSPAGTFWPTVGLNSSNSSVSFGANNAITLLAHEGILHPGPTGALADVRYTASTGFTAVLNVQFRGADAAGSTTDIHILRNGSSLFSDTINGPGDTKTYLSTITLAQGDFLDFAVGWGANSTFIDDSTGFRATLSTETPEPSTFGIALAVLLLLASFRPKCLLMRPANVPQ
jgi:hypothetical protein